MLLLTLTLTLMIYALCSVTAAKIWFEIWAGSWIRVKKIDFSKQISEKFRFCHAISQKNSIFSRKFPKNVNIIRQFNFFPARQKLAIYSYFWATYSISLQKSPLSNILPVDDKL